MSCNKCKEINKVTCGCIDKTDAKCVIYDSVTLQPLCVLKGDNMEEIIKKINDKFRSVGFDIENAFVARNVGGRVEVYKGKNEKGIVDFRTLEGIEGIKVKNDDTTITIHIDEEWLKKYYPKISLKNRGLGISLLDIDSENEFYIKRLKSSDKSISIEEDTTEGIDIKLNTSFVKSIKAGDNVTVDITDPINPKVSVTIPSKTISSIGKGVSIIGNNTSDNWTLSSIKSDTLQIDKSSDGTININSVEKNFGYIKAFYVNSNYVPTADSPSDGSIIRPYTSFEEALNIVIGNGTRLDPQYPGARINLQ